MPTQESITRSEDEVDHLEKPVHFATRSEAATQAEAHAVARATGWTKDVAVSPRLLAAQIEEDSGSRKHLAFHAPQDKQLHSRDPEAKSEEPHHLTPVRAERATVATSPLHPTSHDGPDSVKGGWQRAPGEEIDQVANHTCASRSEPMTARNAGGVVSEEENDGTIEGCCNAQHQPDSDDCGAITAEIEQSRLGRAQVSSEGRQVASSCRTGSGVVEEQRESKSSGFSDSASVSSRLARECQGEQEKLEHTVGIDGETKGAGDGGLVAHGLSQASPGQIREEVENRDGVFAVENRDRDFADLSPDESATLLTDSSAGESALLLNDSSAGESASLLNDSSAGESASPMTESDGAKQSHTCSAAEKAAHEIVQVEVGPPEQSPTMAPPGSKSQSPSVEDPEREVIDQSVRGTNATDHGCAGDLSDGGDGTTAHIEPTKEEMFGPNALTVSELEKLVGDDPVSYLLLERVAALRRQVLLLDEEEAQLHSASI